MKKIYLITFLVLLSVPQSAHSEKTYSPLRNVPTPLLSQLTESKLYELTYIDALWRHLPVKAQQPLTQASIDLLKKRDAQSESSANIREAMAFDRNFDLQVTVEEIRADIAEDLANIRSYSGDAATTRYEVISRSADVLKKYDINGDKKINPEEASSAKTRPDLGLYYEGIEKLLALDPDKNGELTRQELEGLARKAFSVADADKNGVLSWKEAESSKRELQARYARLNNCLPVKPDTKDRVLRVAVIEGGSISDTALINQQRATTVVNVVIEKGETPVFLMLSSWNPVIWRFTGDTARVSAAVLATPATAPTVMMGTGSMTGADENAYLGMGATGLPASKVHFIDDTNDERCVSPTMSLSANFVERTLDIAGFEIPRSAKTSFTRYSPVNVYIGAKNVRFDDTPTAQAEIPLTSSSAGKQSLLFNPGGVVSFSDEKIIANGPTEHYQILPRWAGLDQLVQKGFLEEQPYSGSQKIVLDGAVFFIKKSSNAVYKPKNKGMRTIDSKNLSFKILKPFETFPSGLSDTYGLQFSLPEQMILPQGDLGAACIISEDGGELPLGIRSCAE